MASLTLQSLSDAMRLTVGQPPDAPLAEVIQRMMDTAEELIAEYAPNPPEVVAHQATIEVCKFLYDTQTPLNNAPQVNVLRMSGAIYLLSPWHVL